MDAARWGLLGLGGVAVALAADQLSLVHACATGVPGVDRLGTLFAREGLLYAPLSLSRQQQFARTLATLCWNETGGKTDAPVLGDTNIDSGPSIGPLQVLRLTAVGYGLWEPSDLSVGDPEAEKAEFADLANDEAFCVHLGAQVFRQKLVEAQQDWPSAIRRYNGAGSRAVAYAQRAADFMAQRGWA
jgi:hypothetical protein